MMCWDIDMIDSRDLDLESKTWTWTWELRTWTWTRTLRTWLQVCWRNKMTAYRRGWLKKSPAGWLPVHRDQLRAQRSVTSMGELFFTYFLTSGINFINHFHEPHRHPSQSAHSITLIIATNIHQPFSLLHSRLNIRFSSSHFHHSLPTIGQPPDALHWHPDWSTNFCFSIMVTMYMFGRLYAYR